MPIYEFYSPRTRKIYSFYSRSLKNSEKIPQCPDGKDHKMIKLLSAFSITGNLLDKEELEIDQSSDQEQDPFANLSESQSAHVMNEMEKAMSSMDDENPDPRQMGAMMRKMCEMTGEKMDGVMEEVVRKLEEGEDPERLEENLGCSLEEVDADNDTCEPKEGVPSSRRKQRLTLTRDPKLYEMDEFLS